MKNYLSLIPIAEKVNKKQSRMTRFCIILAVFLITAIFGMADMEIQSQLNQTIHQDGYWHVSLQNVSTEQEEKLRNMTCVEACSRYGVVNYGVDQEYLVAGKRTVICGIDPDFLSICDAAAILDGAFPDEDHEVIITQSMASKLQKKPGDTIILQRPDQTQEVFTVTGISEDTGMLLSSDCYGMFMNADFYLASMQAKQDQFRYYVRIGKRYDLLSSIQKIKDELELSENQLGENVKLLGLLGKSSDSYMLQLYGTAAVLAVLVITAAVLMITSNLNSNLSRRTEFFGMLRCLGASKRQIKNFVRCEALYWCKYAIPAGIVLGSMVVWLLCALLRFLSPAYFSEMPVLGFSIPAMAAGAGIGLVTVLLAAVSPARKAAAVSPLTAVSGNAYNTKRVKHMLSVRFCPVDIRLGICHSMQNKKNFFLMILSFAFSIILFLAFTTAIDFLHHALRPLQVYTPDISIYREDNTCNIPKENAADIQKLQGIKKVYGRSFLYDEKVMLNGEKELNINLLSYEENQFSWSEKKLSEGTLQAVKEGKEILTVFDPQNPVQIGDTLTFQVDNREVEVRVGAVLTDSPFTRSENTETMICSEQLFEAITGKTDYTIIDIQLKPDCPEKTVETIRDMYAKDCLFSDQRQDNRDVTGAYLSMSVFIYGFIVIIAVISIFQIINSIATSVHARIHQYGTMRAIGTEVDQLGRMITAEAVTYGIWGILFGGLLGIPIHKVLFQSMITSRWGDIWTFPKWQMLIIAGVMTLSMILAVYRPVREIGKLSIADTLTTY